METNLNLFLENCYFPLKIDFNWTGYNPRQRPKLYGRPQVIQPQALLLNKRFTTIVNCRGMNAVAKYQNCRLIDTFSSSIHYYDKYFEDHFYDNAILHRRYDYFFYCTVMKKM